MYVHVYNSTWTYEFQRTLSLLLSVQGEVTYAEWKVLTREASMTREQNELLLRQTKLNQSKLNELHTAYQTRCKFTVLASHVIKQL